MIHPYIYIIMYKRIYNIAVLNILNYRYNKS